MVRSYAQEMSKGKKCKNCGHALTFLVQSGDGENHYIHRINLTPIDIGVCAVNACSCDKAEVEDKA